ncbi:MAG: hypothetical protein NZ870_02910, partial [bacterium]|nr:hypothetical protein [bacterium]
MVLKYLKDTGYFQKTFNFLRPIISRTLINLHYNFYDTFSGYFEKNNLFKIYGAKIEVELEYKTKHSKILITDLENVDCSIFLKSKHSFLEMPFVIKIISEFISI